MWSHKCHPPTSAVIWPVLHHCSDSKAQTWKTESVFMGLMPKVKNNYREFAASRTLGYGGAIRTKREEMGRESDFMTCTTSITCWLAAAHFCICQEALGTNHLRKPGISHL